MTQVHDTRFTFDATPLAPVEPGTNLLVAGPVHGGARRTALRLLAGDGDDGLVLITADTDAGTVLAQLTDQGADTSGGRVRIVDCSTGATPDQSEFVATLSSPADLTGIGIAYADQYESVYARGYDKVRTGIYSLNPLLTFCDDVRTVFRFINIVTSRIRTANGLGVCVINPKAHDDRVVSSIAQSFDGRVDVREGGDGLECRVRGLPDQPTDWTPLA